MTRAARRRRSAVLLSLALACGGLAASEVRSRVAAVEERVGSPLPVVVARVDIPAGTRLGHRAVGRVLAVRRVPAGFVPPDALADPADAAGLRLVASLPRGGYLTGGALASGHDAGTPPGPALRRGERAVEVPVAAAAARAGGAAPGARVDVLVTTEGRQGGDGRTYVALEDVELLDLRDAPAGDGAAADGSPAASAAGPRATLRVTARQAVFLTAAQSFAREIRLLARPPGDRRRGPALVVAGGDL